MVCDHGVSVEDFSRVMILKSHAILDVSSVTLICDQYAAYVDEDYVRKRIGGA